MQVNQDASKSVLPYVMPNEQSIAENRAPGPTIQARCTAPKGIAYHLNRIREGDVFTIYPFYVTELDQLGQPIVEDGKIKKRLVTAKEQFSPKTMELVDDDEPVRLTDAQHALNIKQDELNEERAPVRRGPGRPRKEDA